VYTIAKVLWYYSEVDNDVYKLIFHFGHYYYYYILWGENTESNEFGVLSYIIIKDNKSILDNFVIIFNTNPNKPCKYYNNIRVRCKCVVLLLNILLSIYKHAQPGNNNIGKMVIITETACFNICNNIIKPIVRYK